MTSLFHDEPVLVETRHPKKVLIAVDLEEYSEKVVAYALSLMQGIPCEFSLLHSLNSTEGPNLAKEKLASLIGKIRDEINPKSYHTFKIYVFETAPLYAIGTLLAVEHYSAIIIGTSNDPYSNELGATARKIFLNTDANIVVVPPKVTIKPINQVSILVDNSGNVNFDLLNQMRRYVSYQNIFINLFLFIGDRNVLTAYEHELLREYKDFFDENPSFPHIINENDIFSSLCKHIDKKSEDLVIITWNKDNTIQNAYHSIVGERYNAIFCNPFVPIYVSKEKTAILIKEIKEFELSK